MNRRNTWAPPILTPPPTPERSKLWLIPIIGALMAFFALLAATVGNEPDAPVFDSDAWQAHAQCADFTRARLKSPATADFPEWDDPGVSIVRRGRWWQVSSFVDSHNGFGALVRTPFTCEVADLGDQWRLEDWAER